MSAPVATPTYSAKFLPNHPRRLTNGRAELKEAHWYDYLVVNDDKATALSQLQAIVAAARCRTPQLWPQLAPRYLNNNP